MLLFIKTLWPSSEHSSTNISDKGLNCSIELIRPVQKALKNAIDSILVSFIFPVTTGALANSYKKTNTNTLCSNQVISRIGHHSIQTLAALTSWIYSTWLVQTHNCKSLVESHLNFKHMYLHEADSRRTTDDSREEKSDKN